MVEVRKDGASHTADEAIASPRDPNEPCLPLASKIDFLRQPSSYGGPVRRVESIETHMSWVFLAGNFAYKLKKPVRTDFFDFRSLAARRYFCSEELRLNRRLAGPIYIEVLPLTLDCAHQLHLGGDGAPVDWLIKMHRLPVWLMLDFAIMFRSATIDDVERVARALASFYRELPRERPASAAYRARFQRQIQTDRVELGDPMYGLPRERINGLCSVQSVALSRLGELLDERIATGKLVEGHGDLRPEHVCLLPEIAIIDCLEFSRELRVLDQADEVAYLALECERRGAGHIGGAIMESYRSCSGDEAPASLVHFYQSCRASKRAVLAVRHLREQEFLSSPHWRGTALAYLELARRHADACRPD